MQVYSSHDMLALVGELFTRRIGMVVGKAAKRRGVPMKVLLETAPERAQEGIKAAKVLHNRYRNGDYRHSDLEAGRMIQLCNWLHELHGSTRNPVIDAEMLQAKTPCKPGMYQSLIPVVREELG